MDRRHPPILLLALLALLLRVAIPPGWMPSADAGTPFALCTAGGLVDTALGADPSTPQSPPQDSANPLHCAFALGGASPLATAPALHLPAARAMPVRNARRSARSIRLRYRELRSARAPPA